MAAAAAAGMAREGATWLMGTAHGDWRGRAMKHNNAAEGAHGWGQKDRKRMGHEWAAAAAVLSAWDPVLSV
jgi:hypothetical protein